MGSGLFLLHAQARHSNNTYSQYPTERSFRFHYERQLVHARPKGALYSKIVFKDEGVLNLDLHFGSSSIGPVL